MIDDLDIPACLLVANRVPLTPEQAQRVRHALANVPKPAKDWKRLDELRKAERRQKARERLERLLISKGKIKSPVDHSGQRWCVTTCKWVPNE